MIDWQRVAELRDEIGSEDFGELVELFMAEVEETLEALDDAAGDAVRLSEIMHFLKGSALNLGFSTVARLCRDGEIAAASGTPGDVDIDAVKTAFAASREQFLDELPRRMAA